MRFPHYTCILIAVLPGKWKKKQEVSRGWWEGFFSEDVDFVPIEMNVMEFKEIDEKHDLGNSM